MPLAGLTLQAQATSPVVGEFWTFVQGQLFGGSPTGLQVLAAATGAVALLAWGFKAVSRQARRMKKRIQE